MATIKKAKAGIRMKKAEDGVSQAGVGPSSDEKERQFGKAPAKSQAGVGPSSNEKERQGDKTTSAKAPPNSFRSEAAEAAAKSSAPAKKQSFGEAFKAARTANKGPFKWTDEKGVTRSYSTDTKEDVAKKTVAAKGKAATMKARLTPANEAAAKKSTPATPSTSRPNPNGPESEAPVKKSIPAKAKSIPSSKPESSKKPYQPFPNSSESETSSKKSTPAKKIEPPKSITTSPKLSPQDSVLNRMRINNDALMAKQNRFSKKPFGSALKFGGKITKSVKVVSRTKKK